MKIVTQISATTAATHETEADVETATEDARPDLAQTSEPPPPQVDPRSLPVVTRTAPGAVTRPFDLAAWKPDTTPTAIRYLVHNASRRTLVRTTASLPRGYDWRDTADFRAMQGRAGRALAPKVQQALSSIAAEVTVGPCSHGGLGCEVSIISPHPVEQVASLIAKLGLTEDSTVVPIVYKRSYPDPRPFVELGAGKGELKREWLDWVGPARAAPPSEPIGTTARFNQDVRALYDRLVAFGDAARPGYHPEQSNGTIYRTQIDGSIGLFANQYHDDRSIKLKWVRWLADGGNEVDELELQTNLPQMLWTKDSWQKPKSEWPHHGRYEQLSRSQIETMQLHRLPAGIREALVDVFVGMGLLPPPAVNEPSANPSLAPRDVAGQVTLVMDQAVIAVADPDDPDATVRHRLNDHYLMRVERYDDGAKLQQAAVVLMPKTLFAAGAPPPSYASRVFISKEELRQAPPEWAQGLLVYGAAERRQTEVYLYTGSRVNLIA